MDRSGPYRKAPPSLRPRPGVVACPACETELTGEPRLCTICGTPIATVRCAECFHMNLPDSALCTGCGRELGLEPVGEPDRLSCPDCKRPFSAFSGVGGILRDCATCGGQFVEHALLKALLEQREVYGAAPPRNLPRANPLEQPVRYVPCPACSDVMARRNFGRTSGVIVDVCAKHGTWFDAGELPRVLAFVEAGGLVLARQREADEKKDQARRERIAAVERQLEPLSAPGSSWNRMENTRRSVEMADAGVALFDFVSGLLR